MLITSRSSGLAPDPRNELRISHDSAIVLQISKRIERENKSAAELLKLLANLDPDEITRNFLEAVFEQHTKPFFIGVVLEMEYCKSLTLLEKVQCDSVEQAVGHRPSFGAGDGQVEPQQGRRFLSAPHNGNGA